MFERKTSRIRGAGDGLFATKDLPAGTKLGEYYGRRTKNHPYGSYVFNVNIYENGKLVRHEYINAEHSSCMLRYVNGAKTPAQQKKINVESYQYDGRIFFKTSRQVSAGEELILDYGDEYTFD